MLAAAPDLFTTLCDLLPTGVAVLAPLYEATGTLADFRLHALNPAAQRLLGLPARPATTLLAQRLLREALVRCREVYASGEPAHFELRTQEEELDSAYRLDVQRSGDWLLLHVADLPAPDLASARQQLRAHRAEAAQAQARLQAIFSQVPLGLALYEGPAHTVALANDDICAMWGHPLAEVLGQPLLDAVPELRGQQFDTLLTQVLRTGQPFTGAEALATVHRAGQGLVTRYFDFTFQVLRGSDERVLGVLNSAQDVTERVLARHHIEQLNQELVAAQAEAERRRGDLQRVLEQAPVAMAIFRGPDHIIEQANDLHLALWGRTATQVLGRPLFEALPEAAGQGFEELLQGVLTTGQPYVARELSAELVRHGVRERVYFHFVYQPLHEADGQISGVVVVATDITEQVQSRQLLEQLNQQLEQRVAARTQQLREQERVLYRVLEQAPVAIAILRGPQFVVELANATVGAIWGRDPAQALGRPYFEAVPDTADQGFEKILAGVLATGQPFFVKEAPVTFAQTPTAPPRQAVVNFGFHPLYDEHGATWGLMAVGVEVTEQVQARQQVDALNQALTASNADLRDANARLARTNADLDTFVYTASHDLKAPITNLKGLIEALRQEVGTPAADACLIAHMLTLADKDITRFLTTLGHLTSIVELQQASTPVEMSTGEELSQLLEDVRLDLSPRLAATRAQLHVALHECPPRVRYSPKNLRSILFNLLSNALKYHAPDRPPVVQVRVSCDADWLEVRVRDNGLGLTPAQQGNLFKLFQRLHTHIEGAGVGLYAIKRLIDNAGGDITVESQQGVGSTFIVRLPQ